jgi:hypothetical protein
VLNAGGVETCLVHPAHAVGTGASQPGDRRTGDGPVSTPSPKGKMIFHSDRGSQYASDDFRNVLDQHGV